MKSFTIVGALFSLGIFINTANARIASLASVQQKSVPQLEALAASWSLCFKQSAEMKNKYEESWSDCSNSNYDNYRKEIEAAYAIFLKSAKNLNDEKKYISAVNYAIKGAWATNCLFSSASMETPDKCVKDAAIVACKKQFASQLTAANNRKKECCEQTWANAETDRKTIELRQKQYDVLMLGYKIQCLGPNPYNNYAYSSSADSCYRQAIQIYTDAQANYSKCYNSYEICLQAVSKAHQILYANNPKWDDVSRYDLSQTQKDTFIASVKAALDAMGSTSACMSSWITVHIGYLSGRSDGLDNLFLCLKNWNSHRCNEDRNAADSSFRSKYNQCCKENSDKAFALKSKILDPKNMNELIALYNQKSCALLTGKSFPLNGAPAGNSGIKAFGGP